MTNFQLTLQKSQKVCQTYAPKTPVEWGKKFKFNISLFYFFCNPKHVFCKEKKCGRWSKSKGYLTPAKKQEQGSLSLGSGLALYCIPPDPWQKSCLSHKIDCRSDEKPPCVYNNNSLSTDTWAAAVIFTSPQWGNIDICKSTEGIRQGFLPPAVHGQRHAGSNRELCGSLLRMERIWRSCCIIPILPKQSHQHETRAGGEVWLCLFAVKKTRSLKGVRVAKGAMASPDRVTFYRRLGTQR